MHIFDPFGPQLLWMLPNAALRQHLSGLQSFDGRIYGGKRLIEFFSLKSSAGKLAIVLTAQNAANSLFNRYIYL